MSDERTYGRKPVVIGELRQPRCSKRFGEGLCTATGTPCYNIYWTCGDKENFDTDGSIAWRFSRPSDDVGWLYEEGGPNDIRTNAIPLLLSASHSSSRINPGASRDGESPLGRRASAQIQVANAVWDDHVGDFYRDARPARDPAGFWTLIEARTNSFTPDMVWTTYEGYEGQSLSEMQSRELDVEQISGPSGGDQYTITCRDPLDAVRGKNALYPPTSQIDLAKDISATANEIEVTCLEAELSLELGNSGRYAVIGDEAISFTGWTGTEPDFTLTGIERGALDTTAQAHSANAAVQRGAYHVNQRLYDVARYIIKSHTTVSNTYLDDAQWDEEGDTYLSTLQCRTFLHEPIPVEDLLGELCQSGLFSIYWDDRRQTIPLLAVRPPKETPAEWSDDNNIAGFSKATKIDDRLTRVSMFFRPRDFFDDLEESKNYENRRIRVDAEVEGEAAGGKIFEKVIYSRWSQTFSNALLVSASLLLRYRLPPQYITIELDAKDRATKIGDVIDLTTRHVRDAQGSAIQTRWQVIAVSEPRPGSSVRAELQSFQFVGKFAIIMANDAPKYADATDAEKEAGCWLAENTGVMPDGSEPYLLQ